MLQSFGPAGSSNKRWMRVTMEGKQEKAFMTIRLKSFLSIALLCYLLPACNDGDDATGVDVSNVNVNEELILYNVDNLSLQSPGGYRYLSAGRKGIIVYCQTTVDYRAFERTCPYDPKVDSALVQMDDSGLFLIDKNCGSSFDFNGQVTGGPARAPLARYQTSLNQNILRITN